jgi:cytochrome c peroxidase
MSLGKRDAAETAVRSGIRHILFTQQPEEVAVAMDAYLKALKPVPSPLLVNGKLSERARRGAKLYANSNVDCSSCHPQGLFTDLRHYDTGTAGPLDQGVTQFDTPTLIEVWRTAPYLHDGSAATVRDLLTIRNKDDRHGRTSHLTPQQIDDLVEYVLSL